MLKKFCVNITLCLAQNIFFQGPYILLIIPLSVHIFKFIYMGARKLKYHEVDDVKWQVETHEHSRQKKMVPTAAMLQLLYPYCR
jgi:hypothetical protein